LFPPPSRGIGARIRVRLVEQRLPAPSPLGRGDGTCALCDKDLELNLAPMRARVKVKGREEGWANERMRYRTTSIARLCRLAQAAVKT
jgi:hypothetical protein